MILFIFAIVGFLNMANDCEANVYGGAAIVVASMIGHGLQYLGKGKEGEE